MYQILSQMQIQAASSTLKIQMPSELSTSQIDLCDDSLGEDFEFSKSEISLDEGSFREYFEFFISQINSD